MTTEQNTGSGPLTVEGGRVTRIDIGAEPGDDIRVTTQPDHGHLSVNPDGSLALVLSGSDYTGRLDFTAEIVRGGATEMVNQALTVAALEQADGWGAGDHYTLRTDAQGDSVIEHGAIHRKVHASDSPDALSVEDIAQIEGVPAGRINGAWLAERPEYGTQNQPLDPEAASILWREITGDGPASHHLLLERGYEYDMQRIIGRGVSGESELAPIYVGAWGDGDQPVITQEQKIFQSPSSNIVFDDLEFTGGITILGGQNMLFEDLTVHEDGLNIQRVDKFTLRDSQIIDVADDTPSGREWQPHQDRESGIFTKGVEGLLMEGNFFHHNGWQQGYSPDGRNLEAQNPTKFSHNVYIQYDSRDVTFRDNVTAQGASFGAQIRPGGHVVDNLFLDNNAGLNVLGGQDRDKDGVRDGNFSLLLGNVVTSAGHLRTDDGEGALARGIDNAGLSSTLVDNVVAHLANPADSAEQARKTENNGALRNSFDPVTDDTIVYNWIASGKVYRDGALYEQSRANTNVDVDNPDAVTIQQYTAELLGGSQNTIVALTDHLRDLYADGRTSEDLSADEITQWFLDGFGQSGPDGLMLAAQSGGARFVPQDHSDGIRWDNPLNWTGRRQPGQQAETADLGGNHVIYSGTATLDQLDLGATGALSVGQGYLALREGVSAGAGGGHIHLDGAGQFWTNGSFGDMRYTAEGGRLVFQGEIAGAEALAVDARDGQVVLSDGAHMILGAGDSLTVRSDAAQVGFDGDRGSALLEMTDGAILAFGAETGRLGHLGPVQSGAFAGGEMTSGLVLDGTLRLDLSELNPPGGRAVDMTLLEADEIVGQFDRIEVAGLNQGQAVEVVLDYGLDTLVIRVQGGDRGVEISTIGEPLAFGDDVDDLRDRLSDIRTDRNAPEIVFGEPLPTFGADAFDYQ